MLFVDVAAASDEVAAASARTAKVTRLAALLRQLSPAEAEVTVSWLSGALTQRQIGVGWAALRGELPEPAAGATLTIEAVEATFTRIGRGHRSRLPAGTASAAARPVRGGNRPRASVLEAAARRRAPAGRVARRHGRRRGPRRRRAPRRCPTRGDASGRSSRGRRRCAGRWRAGARRLPAASGPPDRADAGPDRREHRRRAGSAGRRSQRRMEARRRPSADSSQRVGRRLVHPHSGRRDRAVAGNRRLRAGPAGARLRRSTARRSRSPMVGDPFRSRSLRPGSVLATRMRDGTERR